MPVAGHGSDGAPEVAGVGGVVEEAGLEVADDVRRPAGSWGNHRDARGRCLAEGVAAGLLLAGVDQQVKRGEGDGEVAGLERAGEPGVGQPPLQPLRSGPSPMTTSRVPATSASSARRRAPLRLWRLPT